MWTHSARLASVISLKIKKHLLKTNFKQIKEKVIEGVLMLSSATSITVILIVFFYLSKVLGFY
jgi:phosphate transport system permease protein